MTQQGGTDRQRMAALVAELNKLQASKADPTRRDQVLDELQDLVGLAGKMVMESDIMRKAKKILGEG